MKNKKINIIDGIMGSGKSTGIINLIKNKKEKNPEEKFLIIVPYLSEVDRYSKNLKGFKKIINDRPPKKTMLEKHLENGEDIICTHALFLANQELIYTYSPDYNLIIDEAINSLIFNLEYPKLINIENIDSSIKINNDNTLSLKYEDNCFSYSNEDIKNMFKLNLLVYEPQDKDNKLNFIRWNNSSSYTGIYDFYKNLFSTYNVVELHKLNQIKDDDNNAIGYMCLFPVDVFLNFKDIYILTYLWNSQLMKYYFDFYNFTYTNLYPIQVINQDGKKDYIISNNYDLYRKIETVVKINSIQKIHIPGYKVTNKISYDSNSRTSLYSFKYNTGYAPSFSFNFYTNSVTNQEYKPFVDSLKCNIKNFVKNNVSDLIKSDKNIIWTVFKNSKDIIKTNCTYINDKNFVPINTKATNDYSSSNVLIYLVDRYINPFLYNFIVQYCPNTNFDKDLYSLSEFIQWIWRSNIRNNKDISIYIPSDRMRNLLLDWLNDFNIDCIQDK